MGHRDFMYVEPAYAEALSQAGLNTVEAVLNCTGDRLSAWSRTTDTIQIQLTPGLRVFVKRYHYPRWQNRIKAMFRGTFFGLSRVRAEFHSLSTMRGLGIHAVRPIAYGERRSLHFLHDCFLITEAVPGAVSLVTYAQQHVGNNHSPAAFRRRREMVNMLARQVRHMHDQGIVHGELFWRNVLVRILGEGGCEFYFVDAVFGRRIWRKSRRRRRIMEDLAELTAIAPTFCSRADMARFARTYLLKERFDGTERSWMAGVIGRSKAFRKHEMRRLQLNELFSRHICDVERLDRMGN